MLPLLLAPSASTASGIYQLSVCLCSYLTYPSLYPSPPTGDGQATLPESKGAAMTMSHRVLLVLSILLGGGMILTALVSTPNVPPWGAVVIAGAIVAGVPWVLFYFAMWLGASCWPWKKILVAILLLLFAWFIWPTPYKYLGQLRQVNRLTGALCRVGASCW